MYSCQLFGSEDFFLILSFFLFPIFCLTNQAMGKDQTALAQDSIQRREDARPARFNAFLSRDWTVRSLRLCRTPPTVAHCWQLLLPVQPSPFAMRPLPLTIEAGQLSLTPHPPASTGASPPAPPLLPRCQGGGSRPGFVSGAGRILSAVLKPEPPTFSSGS